MQDNDGINQNTDLVTHVDNKDQSIAIHDRDLALTCFKAITSIVSIPRANYYKQEVYMCADWWHRVPL